MYYVVENAFCSIYLYLFIKIEGDIGCAMLVLTTVFVSCTFNFLFTVLSFQVFMYSGSGMYTL